MSGKILVVDDEPKLVRVVRAYLERAGFRVVAAYNGQEALALFRYERPDLVMLHSNLPGVDGLDGCRALRRSSDVSIIVLTARVEEADWLIGPELGADDYIVKPFSPREVVARVRAVLRRAQGLLRQPELIRAGDVTLALRRRRARAGDRLLDLTPMEFDLLVVLARRPGQVFSRMRLLDQVHGKAFEGYERTIDVHVKNLRKKLGEGPRRPHCVETAHGVGYRFLEKTADA